MTTLTDIYDKMISNGSLEDDPCQRKIVEQLENINLQISNLKKKSIFFRKSSDINGAYIWGCLLYTSPSPRDRQKSRMPSSA